MGEVCNARNIELQGIDRIRSGDAVRPARIAWQPSVTLPKRRPYQTYQRFGADGPRNAV